MDKDAQMISLVLNTTKDLFQIVRKGCPGLPEVLDEIHDASKPYAQKLAEPGVITENNDLIEMRGYRASIKSARTPEAVVAAAKEVLAFLQKKNDLLDAEEIDTSSIADITTPGVDASDVTDNTSTHSGESDTPDLPNPEDEPINVNGTLDGDGEISSDEPDNGDGSSSSDS
ncbi:MAG: hypothetical protein AAGG75_08660 [Bacteroidota bacterium]